MIVPEHNFYRDYQYHIAGNNIINSGISDWVRHYFPCHPDNRGIAIVAPEPQFYYYAFQQGSASYGTA